jgi:hypothetical protein
MMNMHLSPLRGEVDVSVAPVPRETGATALHRKAEGDGAFAGYSHVTMAELVQSITPRCGSHTRRYETRSLPT